MEQLGSINFIANLVQGQVVPTGEANWNGIFCRQEMDVRVAQNVVAGRGCVAAMVMEQEAMLLKAARDLDHGDHGVQH
jgi:hypothetical protein